MPDAKIPFAALPICIGMLMSVNEMPLSTHAALSCLYMEPKKKKKLSLHLTFYTSQPLESHFTSPLCLTLVIVSFHPLEEFF